VVFPEYYFGQIFEAQQQPGTVAYSLETQLTLLQETVKEMARNGCKKMLIVNGHGGNNSCCRSSRRRNWPARATTWFTSWACRTRMRRDARR
jgi:creatinine amidohydrolase/Fe(II)-dependent formamide hydrolase-like protein